MQPERFSEVFIANLRGRVSIVDVASRHVAWDKRKTVAARGDFWACCPFHDEKSPSFHVRESVGTFKCFGCGAGGDVIELLMHLERLTFPAAVRKLAGVEEAPQERNYAERQHVEEMPDPEKRRVATRVWDAAEPVAGTIAEAYLRARGIGRDLSDADLRFHPAAPEGYKLARGKFPAMVAAIRTPQGELIGAHLTYLLSDGSWKRPSEPQMPDRRVLAKKEGGFIRLAPLAERMVVGEGIESAFSAAEMSGRPPLAAVTSENMAKLPLIDGVKDMLVAYDRDAKGQGFKAGKALAARLFAAGLVARAYPPPNDCKDWNDASQRRRV